MTTRRAPRRVPPRRRARRRRRAPRAARRPPERWAPCGTQFSWVPDIEWAAWYLAESKGFFAARGVESVLGHGGPNTPAVVQLLAAGDGDIGLSGDELEILKANKTGADYVAIAAMYQRSPFGYAWLTETNITGAADLVGKRIGGVQGDQIRIEAVFTINDLPVDYEFVPMSFDPQPLVDGEMDVITAYVTNQPVQLAVAGHRDRLGAVLGLRAQVVRRRDLRLEGVPRREPRPRRGVPRRAARRCRRQPRRPHRGRIPILVDTYGADNEIDEAYATAGNPAYIALMDSDFTTANGLLVDGSRLPRGRGLAGARRQPVRRTCPTSRRSSTRRCSPTPTPSL